MSKLKVFSSFRYQFGRIFSILSAPSQLNEPKILNFSTNEIHNAEVQGQFDKIEKLARKVVSRSWKCTKRFPDALTLPILKMLQLCTVGNIVCASDRAHACTRGLKFTFTSHTHSTFRSRANGQPMMATPVGLDMPITS